MWRRKKQEHDLERELRSDLEMEASEQLERGLSPEEARHAAQRALGNSTLIKEEVRQMWGWTRWEIVIQDVRYALRMLRKSPGFAMTAILTLALGIGASTAVFTAVDSVVLKPLGYRDSGSLVALWELLPFNSFAPAGPNPRHADLWQKRATAFSGLTLLRQGASGLTLGADHPRLVGTLTATPNLLEILQATPLLGRGFVPEDGVPGHDSVAILTYAAWQSLFQGDPNVIGKTVRLADTPREVVGVLPASFHFPNANSLHAFRSKQAASSAPEPAIVFPALLDPNQFGWNGDYGNWIAIARLKPGFSVSQAEAQLTSIQAQIFQEIPAREKNAQLAKMGAYVQPMQEAVVGDSKTGLWLLMAAVIGLMLIACVNLASAQLGRALSRQREAAVRSALGASKWRLVWNSLAENLVLAAVGGAAGIALAAAGIDLFRHYAPLDLPRLSEVHINMTVLLFSLALTLGSSLLFGVLPAVKLLRTDPQASLQKSNHRSLGNRQSHRLRSWLIAAQVFGCTVLLLVTGLFLKSFLYLLHQDKGFETGQVIVAEVNLPGTTYSADQMRTAFDDAVLENLRAIPGVQSAGFVSSMPLEGEHWIEGIQRVDLPSRQALVNLRWVSPGYFETTRQRLIAGRFFEELDRSASSAVLSESLAKSVWENQSPIGGQLIVEGRKFTVTGIVADSRNASLKAPPPRMVYLHYKDRPPFTAIFMARSALAPDALAPSMRQAIWKYAPDITIARVKTLDSQLGDSLATERFQTSALMSFGVAALLLAMLGIYGVLSYSTVTRRQEIGMRMALGASRRGIYGLIVGEASVPVFVGLSAGLIASVAAGRVIQKLLYGTQAVDASVILIVAALFLAAAVAAAFLPARRAASVDPMEALRSE
jgi:predicted permease